jgi:hypothetical protein
MRKLFLAFAFFLCLFAVAPTFAQSPNHDVGPVWRVTYYHIKPGMGDAFWKDFRENFKPRGIQKARLDFRLQSFH